MTTTSDTDLKELKDLILGLDKKLDFQRLELERSIDNKFSELDRKIDNKISELDKKIEILQVRTDQRFNTVDAQFKGLDAKFEAIDFQFKALDRKVDDISTKVTSLEGRVNTQLNWFLTAFVILTTGLLGGLVTVISKFIPFNNP
jgi:chromosome segregation ATPase